MTTRQTRLVRRLWLIEQMHALNATMGALEQPAAPPPWRDDWPGGRAAYLDLLLVYHVETERYCQAFDTLHARYAEHAREILADITSDPGPLPQELTYIAAFDQWQEANTDALARDAEAARGARDHARRLTGWEMQP